MRRGSNKPLIGAVALLLVAAGAGIWFGFFHGGDDAGPQITAHDQDQTPTGDTGTNGEQPHTDDPEPDPEPEPEPQPQPEPEPDPQPGADRPPDEPEPTRPPPPETIAIEITGKVLDSNNRPLQSATVYAARSVYRVPGPNDFDFTTMTDFEGGFSIQFIVSDDAEQPEQLALSAHLNENTSRTFVIEDVRQHSQPVTLVIAESGGLQGQILDDGGLALSGVTVVLRDAGAQSPSVRESPPAGGSERYEATTDGGGAFQMEGLRAGTYRVEIRGRGYRMFDGPATVTIRAGEQADVTWAVGASATVGFTLTDARGQPIRARVAYAIETDPPAAGHGNPLPDGSVWLVNLPEGAYEMLIVVQGFKPHRTPTITALSGQHVDLGTIALERSE